jgi:hypothetical protein
VSLSDKNGPAKAVEGAEVERLVTAGTIPAMAQDKAKAEKSKADRENPA